MPVQPYLLPPIATHEQIVSLSAQIAEHRDLLRGFHRERNREVAATKRRMDDLARTLVRLDQRLRGLENAVRDACDASASAEPASPRARGG